MRRSFTRNADFYSRLLSVQ